MPRSSLPHQLVGRPFAFADAAAAQVSVGRLRGPDLFMPYRGVRAPIPSPASTLSDRERALRRCSLYAPLLKPGDFFSHETAALLWGCPWPGFGQSEPPLHVTSTAPRRAHRSRGVIGHITLTDHATPALRLNGETRVSHIVSRWGYPVSTPAATWLALAGRPLSRPDRHQPNQQHIDELVAAGDHLILDPVVLDPRDLRPYATLEQLNSAIAGFSGRGARAAASALLLIRQGAESRPESLLRLLLQRAGLPEPDLNADIRDASGRWLARGDLVYPRYSTLVEYDGAGHLANTAQYDKDITRIENLVFAGQRVVRVRSRGLFVTPADTIARVTRALRQGGWAGSSGNSSPR